MLNQIFEEKKSFGCARTRKENQIAGTVTYIHVLPTCATIVFLGSSEQPEIHNLMHEWVYFCDGALVIFL